jgi:hypothetical protein
MAGGYCYGESEPKERCPYCGALCMADFVDIGVGYTQCGPYHCEACHASEIGPCRGDNFDQIGDGRPLSEKEIQTGWYAPETPPDALANTDSNGRVIRYFEADTLYRKSLGVAPRYDMHGRLLSN